MPERFRPPAAFLLALFLSVAALAAQPPRVTAPQQQFGHEIGADYRLPNYTQLTEWWKKLDAESDRMQLVSIGRTAEGREQWMAIVTAPENLARLDRYKDIARRLALAEDLTDEQARALAREGRAVVWIDGGLHATEVLGAQQLMETVYQLVSRSDEETLRLLRDAIVLAVHANPDGMELVSNWYMRQPDPLRRSTSGLPRLYQKYIGHDNNRDLYMMNQPESTNMNRVLYREWFPQIVYNHHQTGPTGTVMFAPPFRDPFNYVIDPLVVTTLDQVGAAMHARFVAERKPGVTMRSGANYSTWWNGGLRTTAYFHNMIGLLTETIGSPTPIEIGFVPERQLPRGDLPFPIAPQLWRFRQSIDYSVTANRAVLDFASRYREPLLYNIYLMGRDAIARGSTDTWTTYPRRIARVREAVGRAEGRTPEVDARTVAGGLVQSVPTKYAELLRRLEDRDPRGYVIPSDQPDFLTAIKFVNILIKAGVTVHQATASFSLAGRTFPAGSYVVKAAQAFRPHVLDMFEPQDHPNDFQYPGGPPVPPYDIAGWTPAFQMGIAFHRILDPIDGPFERVPDVVRPPAGRVTEISGAAGYVVSHRINDAAIAVNRLLAAGEEVYWVRDRSWHSADGAGVIFIAARPSTAAILRKAAADIGLSFEAVRDVPAGETMRLRPVRIGLWDQYGGSMPSGWVRWLLEQFEFPYELVFPQTLDAGKLNDRYDVLLFADGGIPDAIPRASDSAPQPKPEEIPPELRDRLGHVTVSHTVPQLKAFTELGGTVVAFGGSAVLAYHLRLPVTDHLADRAAGRVRPMRRDKFYVPGSILQIAVDNTHPLAYGMERRVDVFFDQSPVLRLNPDATRRGLVPVAWFDRQEPLRSGWAWGQHLLQGGVAAVEARLGRGKVLIFGPEITFRGQPHGTFKFLFNSIYYAEAASAIDGGRPVTRDGR